MQRKNNVKKAKNRSSSSTAWLLRHINDPFVQKAKEAGYISRAAFKLLEIDKKFQLFKKSLKYGNLLLDLGAAPGSWLQVLVENIKNCEVQIFALDLREISYHNDKIIKIIGDFTDEKTLSLLKSATDTNSISLVLSDMAPNSCGNKKTDHLRIMTLAEEVLTFMEQSLVAGGNGVIKVLQGVLSQKLNKIAQNLFNNVYWYKPKASYSDSTELYLILIDKKKSIAKSNILLYND
jgi:23S rRNA (uridine2552-2'-O)-methyltransferase